MDVPQLAVMEHSVVIGMDFGFGEILIKFADWELA